MYLKHYTLSSQHVGRSTNRKHRRVHFSPSTTVPKLNTTATLGVRNKISHSYRTATIAHGALNSAAIAHFEVPITTIRQLGSELVVPTVVSCVLSQPTNSVSKFYPTVPVTVTNF